MINLVRQYLPKDCFEIEDLKADQNRCLHDLFINRWRAVVLGNEQVRIQRNLNLKKKKDAAALVLLNKEIKKKEN